MSEKCILCNENQICPHEELNIFLETHGIEEWSASLGEMEYMHVPLNDDLRALMEKYNHEFDENRVDEITGCYDISYFAFELADWFDGEKFTMRDPR